MFRLSDEAKQVIADTLGLAVGKVSELDFDEEVKIVQKRTGKKLLFPKNVDLRKIGRGSPLVAEGRITTNDDIERKIEEAIR